METEYILDSSHVGFTFPEVDGYILSLVRSRGPYQNCHAMNWEERHFVLRDKTPRAVFCIDAINYGRVPLTIGGAQFFMVNASLRFFGALTLACVPSGSEWELTLSTTFVAPLPPLHPTRSWGFAPFGYWGNYPSYRNWQQWQQQQQRQKQLALAAPPLQLTGPVTEKIEGA